MSSAALCIAVAAEHFDVPRREMISHRRNRRTSWARHVAVWLAKSTTTLSLPAIGAAFDRDHTTIQNAIDVVDRRRREDPAVREELAALVLAVEASLLASEQMRFMPRLPVAIDPVAVAERVLATERGATRVAVDELRVLAEAVLCQGEDIRLERVLGLARSYVEARRAARQPFAHPAARIAAIALAGEAFAALEAAIDDIDNSPAPTQEVTHERRAGTATRRG